MFLKEEFTIVLFDILTGL